MIFAAYNMPLSYSHSTSVHATTAGGGSNTKHSTGISGDNAAR
jgi:hypothetical protein